MRLAPLARVSLAAVPLLLACAGAQRPPATPQDAAREAAATAVPFRSAAGGYRVRLAAPPQEQAQADEKGGLRTHIAVAATADRSLAQVVAWSDQFPEVKAAQEKLFDNEVKGLRRPGDRSFDQGPATFAGVPGRAFRIEREDGKVVTGRVLLSGVRVFAVFAIAAPGGAAPRAEPFLDSFVVEGPGHADPPRAAAGRRVAVPAARISVEMHGEPERSPLVTEGLPPGQNVAARSRGGLWLELVTFQPLPREVAKNRTAVLDGVLQGVRQAGYALSDVRDAAVDGRPARDYRTTISGMDAFGRVVVLDEGTVMLQLIGPPGTVRAEEALAYFRSMRRERAAR